MRVPIYIDCNDGFAWVDGRHVLLVDMSFRANRTFDVYLPYVVLRMALDGRETHEARMNAALALVKPALQGTVKPVVLKVDV